MDDVKSLDQMLDEALDAYYKYPDNPEIKNKVNFLLNQKDAQSKLKYGLNKEQKIEEKRSFRIPEIVPGSFVRTVSEKTTPEEPDVDVSDTYSSADIDKEHFKNFLKAQLAQGGTPENANSISRAPASMPSALPEEEEFTQQDKKMASWYKDPEEWRNLKRMMKKK